jgi:hypothetical protein
VNVAENLAREIRRVADLRHHYEEIGNAGGFALLMIDAALEEACKAAGVDDVVAQIAAGQRLQSFEA